MIKKYFQQLSVRQRVLAGLAVLFVLFSVWIVFSISFLPDVSILRKSFPVIHYMGQKKSRIVRFETKHPAGWISLSVISKAALGAVVVSEDWAFYSHEGYDVNQIKEAIKESIEEKRLVRGASTITQQVARNVFLDNKKRIIRKLKELVLAVKMEDVLSKRRILEIYFNIAEWGEGIFGISEASQFYFNKSPAALTAKEGAFLAMLLPNPKKYSQSFQQKKLSHFALKTINSILNKMQSAGYLTEEELEMALSDRLSFEQIEPVEQNDTSEDFQEEDVQPDMPEDTTDESGDDAGS